MEKGRILSITNEAPFSPEAGVTLYPAIVIMDNGDSGTCYMKNMYEYKDGDSVIYEKVGNKIKIKGLNQISQKPQSKYKGGSKNPEDFLGFVYGYAKDIHIAEMQITKKPIPLDQLKKNVEEIYAHIQEILLMK